MDMLYIVILVVLGLLFLLAELLLLPGISIGALLALLCDGVAIYLAFRDYGAATGIIVIVIIGLLSLITTVISLRAKTWQRFSLKQEIHSSSMTEPASEVKIGDRGVTLSRLSPMGKVRIGEKIYEAKSLDAYVDPQREVEVIGFENFSIIVKTLK